MEYVIGILKRELERSSVDETLSPITKAYMRTQLMEAIDLATSYRYERDIIKSENERLVQLLKDNNIDHEPSPELKLARAIVRNVRYD